MYISFSKWLSSLANVLLIYLFYPFLNWVIVFFLSLNCSYYKLNIYLLSDFFFQIPSHSVVCLLIIYYILKKFVWNWTWSEDTFVLETFPKEPWLNWVCNLTKPHLGVYLRDKLLTPGQVSQITASQLIRPSANRKMPTLCTHFPFLTINANLPALLNMPLWTSHSESCPVCEWLLAPLNSIKFNLSTWLL